jgi:hypothetical protein
VADEEDGAAGAGLSRAERLVDRGQDSVAVQEAIAA